MDLIAPSIKLIIIFLFAGSLFLLVMDYLRSALRRFDLGPLPHMLGLTVQAAVAVLLGVVYFQMGGASGLNYRPGGGEGFGYDVFFNINSFNLPLLVLFLFALFFCRLAAPPRKGGELPNLLLIVGLLGAGSAGDILSIYLYYELFILTSLYISYRGGDEKIPVAARLQTAGTLIVLFVLFLVFHYAGSFHLERLLKVAALPSANQPLSAVLLLFSLALALKGGIAPFGAVRLAVERGVMKGRLLRATVSLFLLCRIAFPFSRLEYRLGWFFIGWGLLAIGLAVFKVWREESIYTRISEAMPSLFGFALVSLGLGVEYSSLDCYAAAIRFVALAPIALTGLVLLWKRREEAKSRAEGWLDGLVIFLLSSSLVGLPPLESFWGKYNLLRGAYALPGGIFTFSFVVVSTLLLALLLLPGAYRRLMPQAENGKAKPSLVVRFAQGGFLFLLVAISMDSWWGMGFVRPAAEYIVDYLSY